MPLVILFWLQLRTDQEISLMKDIEKLNVAIKDKPANVNQPVYFKVIQKIFGYSERYLNY